MNGSQGGGGSPGGQKVRLGGLVRGRSVSLTQQLRPQKQANHTYRPVTIMQLHQAYQAASDSEFKIDNVDLDHVCPLAGQLDLQDLSPNVFKIEPWDQDADFQASNYRRSPLLAPSPTTQAARRMSR